MLREGRWSVKFACWRVLVHFEQAWKVVDLPLILTAALARCYGGAKEWERFQPFTSGATR